MYFIFIGWRSTFSLFTLSHLSIRFHYTISRTIVLYSPIYYWWYAAPTVCNNGEFDSEKINLNVSDGVRKICREFRVRTKIVRVCAMCASTNSIKVNIVWTTECVWYAGIRHSFTVNDYFNVIKRRRNKKCSIYARERNFSRQSMIRYWLCSSLCRQSLFNVPVVVVAVFVVVAVYQHRQHCHRITNKTRIRIRHIR